MNVSVEISIGEFFDKSRIMSGVIGLACCVYFTNNKRSEVKHDIEEKCYLLRSEVFDNTLIQQLLTCSTDAGPFSSDVAIS